MRTEDRVYKISGKARMWILHHLQNGFLFKEPRTRDKLYQGSLCLLLPRPLHHLPKVLHPWVNRYILQHGLFLFSAL